jgi:hypothetical protein
MRKKKVEKNIPHNIAGDVLLHTEN